MAEANRVADNLLFYGDNLNVLRLRPFTDLEHTRRDLLNETGCL